MLTTSNRPTNIARTKSHLYPKGIAIVVIPMLMPFVYTAMAIRSLDLARAYDVVQIMTGGGPANRTELIWTYVNRLAFGRHEFALATAMSYITVLVSFLFTYYLFRNLIKSRWTGGKG